MKYLILGMLLISIIVLAGCSQTVVKYQCADGSFVDSATSCSSPSSETNCPELDCSACGTKTQLKEVIKYQCTDGSFKDSISACPQGNAEIKTVSSSDFNINAEREIIANLLEKEGASVSKIAFSSGILEVEYTSKWAGEDMVVREEFDLFKSIIEEIKDKKGINQIKVSAVASMGSIYSVQLSYDESLKTINYEMGFEDWKAHVRG